jgi:hypothetical protein
MVRIVMSSEAPGAIAVAIDNFLETELGPLVVADAKRYAPKRTGAMARSIDHHVEGLTLYVTADTPAYWVEMGHAVFHPSTRVTGPEEVPEEPFLRPALYKYRTPENPSPPATFPVAKPHPGVTYPTLAAWEKANAAMWARARESLSGEVVRAQNKAWKRRMP